MAKAKQLKSGQWRTLVYSHTEIIDGRKVRRYESFTAPTKKESEYLAANFALHKNDRAPSTHITLGAAMEQYIQSRSHILSPVSLRSYENLKKTRFLELQSMQINKITQTMIQLSINQMSASLSPRTVSNAYFFLKATMAMFRPSFSFHVNLPKIYASKAAVPDEENFLTLLSLAKDTSLYLPILLAAVLSLRRGEICGLRWKDVDFAHSSIHVSFVRVRSAAGELLLKKPKSVTSERTIQAPSFLMSLLDDFRPADCSPDDFLFSFSPDSLSVRFYQFQKRKGLPPFRLHSLRKYNASVMLQLNIPDKYAMERGGWSNLSVLKNVYQQTFSSQRQLANDTINNYFSFLITPPKE